MRHPADHRSCTVCGGPIDDGAREPTPLSDAGSWVSRELLADEDQICQRCRENRALLAMMYVIDR